MLTSQSSIYEPISYKVDQARRISEKVDESLLCGICQEIPFKPEECSTCQNLFCSECIRAWIEKKAKCPFDCPLPFQGNRPHKLIRQALGGLKYYCIYKQNGCEEVISMDGIENHERKCGFAKISCPFSKECKDEMLRKDLEEHKEKCVYVLTQCEKCLFEISRKEIKNHDCVMFLREKYLKLEKKFEVFMEINDKSIENLTKKVSELECVFMKFGRNFQKINQREKLCQNGHALTWSMGSAINECDLCKEKNCFSRFSCSDCKLKYCISCVYPFLGDGKCPLDHEMTLCQKLIFHSCDLCRKGLDKELVIYNDKKCDFDVCSDCFAKASKN